MAKRYLGGGVSFEQKDVYQEFSEDGGGGSSTLSGLTDVDISNPSDGQMLVYNATSGKWENGAGGGGGFTLLHGTYSKDGESITITLPIAASELYALMRSSTVAFDYTIEDNGESNTCVYPINSAKFFAETGYSDVYEFESGDFSTGQIEATDTVVFQHSEK